MDPVKCHATSKQRGRRCKRWATPGHKVCSSHGSKSPQAREAAAERIASMVHPAIDGLARALASDDLGAVVRAARDLLDRAGYKAPKQVKLEDVTPREPSRSTVDLEKLSVETKRRIWAELRAGTRQANT